MLLTQQSCLNLVQPSLGQLVLLLQEWSLCREPWLNPARGLSDNVECHHWWSNEP